MVATGLTEDEKFLQCKNSYRNAPTKIGDGEIVYIPLDRSNTSSEWTIFYENNDKEVCVDAFFISIDFDA